MATHHSGIKRSPSLASKRDSLGKENADVPSLIPSKPSMSKSLGIPPINLAAVHHRKSVAAAYDRQLQRLQAAAHAPIIGVKQVDSDADSDEDDLAAAVAKGALQLESNRTSAPTSRVVSAASSFRRSGAVSRQTSDAAGGAFQLLRSNVGSANATPTNHSFTGPVHFPGGRRSRSNSLVHMLPHAAVDSEATDSREPSMPPSGQVSRMSSMNRASRPSSGCPTPDIKAHLRSMRMEAAQVALEEEITRRQQRFAPENVLIRRWLTTLALSLSSKLLLESGGRRVAEYNAVLRAKDILSRLFVPVWLLHRVRRRRRACRVIETFIMKQMIKRRLRQRHQATDMIRHFCQNKIGLFQHYARYFVRCAIVVQRAFRVFKKRRDAMVHLNCLFIRKIEEQYWERALEGAQRVVQDQHNKRMDAARREDEEMRVRRRSSSLELPAFSIPALPSVPVDFPTFETVGRIPESILKKNLRPLITAKSRAWNTEVARRTNVAFDLFKRSHRGSMSNIMMCPELCKRVVTVKLPPFRPFLTIEEAYTALDDSVLTLSAMRGIPLMSFHLTDGNKTPVPCEFGTFSTVLSELSLTSDRLMATSSDIRRCSVSDLVTLRKRR